MKILVLMAGRGQRFVDGGYTIPKPLIYYRDKTILEHTTRSCPFIKHNVTTQGDGNRLVFACLEEHKSLQVEKYLYDTYGSDIQIVWFPQVTRGNLETAYLALKDTTKTWERESDLLVLDSDNKYDHNEFDKFIEKIRRIPAAMSVCGFDPKDDRPKWANAVVSDGVNPRVLDIQEKNPDYVSYSALVGTFYFDSINLFNTYAEYILKMGGPAKNTNEFYMSQIPAMYARLKYPVFFHKVTNVVPMGTPEDLEKVSQL